MTDDLTTIERLIGAALATARSKGWRPVDIDQLVKQLRDKQERDLYAHLADGINGWRSSRGITGAAAMVTAQRLLAHLRALPELPVVDTRGDVDAAVLAKVRGLLAKAESTPFDAEADALNAKACELMARHSIDQALLGTTSTRGPVAVRRIMIDDPYARARLGLLSSVARACRCSAIWSPGFGFAHVFGSADDLEATELLFTSLLVQATTAMVATTPPSTSASSTAAYRRAFLVAFGARIGQRLRASAAAVLEEAEREHGDVILPALRAHDVDVDEAVTAFAPHVTSLRMSVSDPRGWQAGTAAGDRAAIATQPPLPRRPQGLQRPA